MNNMKYLLICFLLFNSIGYAKQQSLFEQALKAQESGNLDKAKDLYAKSCNKNKQVNSCFNLAKLYRQNNDIPNTMSYLDKSCEYDYAEACSILADTYYRGYKELQKNIYKAADLYEKACKLGNYDSCANIGYLYSVGEGVWTDKKQAVHYYQIACAQNHPVACSNLAVLYHNGEGVDKNFKEAAKFLEQACVMQHGKSCALLSKLYEAGQGVELNYQQSLKLRKLACSLKYKPACSSQSAVNLLKVQGKMIKQNFGLLKNTISYRFKQSAKKISEHFKKAAFLNLQ